MSYFTDRLKNSFEQGLQVASEKFREVTTTVQEFSRDVSNQMSSPDASGPSAGESGFARARAFLAESSQDVFGTVAEVFDLNALQQRETGKESRLGYYQQQDVCYITDRIAMMGFPNCPEKGRSFALVADLLNDLHGSDYTVWNLSGEKYDVTLFKGQVMDVHFRGFPALTVPVLVRLCSTMGSWLEGDGNNAVVVHCRVGYGRSIALISCLLEWIGAFSRSSDALLFACRQRGIPPYRAVLPTQIRYVQMFHEIMKGKRLHLRLMCLQKIALYYVPRIVEAGNEINAESDRTHCLRPYLRVYHGSECIYDGSVRNMKEENENDQKSILPEECEPEVGSAFEIPIECDIQGDIVLHLMHFDVKTDKSLLLFQYGFHTGYSKPGIIELRSGNLDAGNFGSFSSSRFTVRLVLANSTNPPVVGSSSAEEFDETSASFWAAISKQQTILDNRKLQKSSEQANEEECSQKSQNMVADISSEDHAGVCSDDVAQSLTPDCEDRVNSQVEKKVEASRSPDIDTRASNEFFSIEQSEKAISSENEEDDPYPSKSSQDGDIDPDLAELEKYLESL